MSWKYNPFTSNFDYYKDFTEILSHSDLSDMPDVSGINSNHDARYLRLDQTTPQTVTASPLVNWLTPSKVVFTDVNKYLTSTGIGTSSEFIKGDGSLDLTTYLDTSTAASTYLKLDTSNDPLTGDLSLQGYSGSDGRVLDFDNTNGALGNNHELGNIFFYGIPFTGSRTDMAYITVKAQRIAGSGTGQFYFGGRVGGYYYDWIQTFDGDIRFPNDSEKLLLGAAQDASIYYDATNLVINPKEVGIGILDIMGSVTADNYTSDVAIGTSPYACTSTTLNTNLNADLLDGQHASEFAPAAHALLSATHSDTTASAVARGDIIVGTGATPAWDNYALGTAGKILRSDGTDLLYSTATFADTYGASTILYANGANIIQGLTTGNSGVLITSGTGVPSISTDVPTAVTIGTKYVYRAEGTDIPITDGGTGLSTLTTAYGLLAAGTTATGTIQTLAAGLTTQILVGGGVAALPAWGTDIPTAVTIGTKYIYRADGTAVAVADGGTNLSVYAVGDLLYASATTTLAKLADVATGSYLASGGVGVAPSWATLNQAAVAGLTTASTPTFAGVNSTATINLGQTYYVGGAPASDGTGIFTGYNISYATPNIQNLVTGAMAGAFYSSTGVRFFSNTSQAAGTNANMVMQFTTTGNIILGTQAALATNATNGFAYIPTCAGTPTGTPTAYTGKCAMVFDTTNLKLYCYTGGAWKSTTLA